jgi:5-methylthioadenosine/S-adenosylhomocysteine deaminase
VRGIAAAGCGVAHCPASNAKLGHGTAPLVELLAAGARVGLGSDSMASNDRMDLLDEARLAALAQRTRTGHPDVLPARAALRLATLGGAEALRLDAEVGSLEVGKQADLAAFVLPAGALDADPVTALIFGERPLGIRRVVIAGEERVRDGVVLGFDPGVAPRVSAVHASVHARLSKWRNTLPGG